MSNKPKEQEGMTLIARSVSSLLVGVTAAFGLYIALYGHLTPGGGFAGGIIVAAAFIMLTLTHSKKVSLKKISNDTASILDNIGALMFVVIGVLGYMAGDFFVNWLSKSEWFGMLSSGTVLLSNIAILIKVMAGVFAVFLGLSIFGRIVSEGEKGK
jgi:multicomponent Na+:H+ antiporter subunit B